MLLFPLSILAALVLLWIFHKPLKKHPGIFYAVAIAIVLFLVVYASQGWSKVFPAWVNTVFVNPFYRGAFSTALFTVVMYIGALSGKYAPVRGLMQIRGEISIFACLLTLGHNITFGLMGRGEFFVALLTNPLGMPPQRFIATLITLVLDVLMIILLVTSIPSVRKRMHASKWKRVQRLAYPFYLLIYVHVMVLELPSLTKSLEDLPSILIYSVVFLGYAVLRLMKYKRDTQNQKKRPMKKVCTAE